VRSRRRRGLTCDLVPSSSRWHCPKAAPRPIRPADVPAVAELVTAVEDDAVVAYAQYASGGVDRDRSCG
jgi:hypothetical protein